MREAIWRYPVAQDRLCDALARRTFRFVVKLFTGKAKKDFNRKILKL